MFSNNALFLKNSASDAFSGTLMIPENIQVIAYTNPLGRSYQEIRQPLFKQPPCFDDIRQGSSGDCFLLGALFSILALPDGASIITGMFQDNGNHIIVRLFDNECKPCYFSLEKSLPVKWNGLSSRPLWVQFIEKAYAAFKKGDYSALNGGLPDEAMLALTGARYEGFCSLPLQSRKRLASIKEFVNADGIYLFHELMRLSNKTPRLIQEKILKIIFSNDENNFVLWREWLQINNRANQWQQKLAIYHPILIEHVEHFFKQSFSDNDRRNIVKPILQWINDNKILSGPFLSASYSTEELKLFNDLKDKLTSGSAVFVSVHKDLSYQRGVSHKHTFSVQAIEDAVNTPHKYIFVRTPAFDYLSKVPLLSYFFEAGRMAKEKFDTQSRTWHVKIKKSFKIDEAYRMELNDFCRSFDTIYSTDVITQAAINERVEKAMSKCDKLKLFK